MAFYRCSIMVAGCISYTTTIAAIGTATMIVVTIITISIFTAAFTFSNPFSLPNCILVCV